MGTDSTILAGTTARLAFLIAPSATMLLEFAHSACLPTRWAQPNSALATLTLRFSGTRLQPTSASTSLPAQTVSTTTAKTTVYPAQQTVPSVTSKLEFAIPVTALSLLTLPKTHAIALQVSL